MTKINYFEELSEFISIKSISTYREYKNEMEKAVEWLKKKIETLGFKVNIYNKNGHPIVYGNLNNHKDKPTMLIYGHYDVQPPEPLEEWETEPFKLTEKGDFLYARGVSDDKGQLFAHIKALEIFKKEKGEIPFNVKVIFEGEEEIGSPTLPEFLMENKNELKADFAIISDNPMLSRGLPSISYGLRGLLYIEIKLTGPDRDLHSGRFGGVIPNPCIHLCKILSSIKGKDGRIKINGFYEDVLELKKEERENFDKLPISDNDYKLMAKVKKLEKEKTFSAIECIWTRPSFDINGITGGFQGEGTKTIIPSFAKAHLSFRLVPKQDPDKVFKLVEKFLLKNCPKNLKIEIKKKENAFPVLVNIKNKFLNKIRKGMENGFGTEVYLIRQGGTIPVVSLIQNYLKTPVILMGLGLPDENAHAPNEKLLKDNFINGVKSLLEFYKDL